MSEQTLQIRRYEVAALLSERVSKAALELMRVHLQLPDAGGRSTPATKQSYQVIVDTVQQLALFDADTATGSDMREVGKWCISMTSTPDLLGGKSELVQLADAVGEPLDRWTPEVFDELIRFASTIEAFVISLYAQLPQPGARRSTNG